MRWAKLASIMLAALLLQLTVLPQWRISGVMVNLVLVLIVQLALICTSTEALVLAIVSGLVLDAASGGGFGLKTSLLVALSLLVMVLHQAGVQAKQRLVMVAITMLASLVWGLAMLASVGVSSFGALAGWKIVGVELLLNGLLALLIAPPLNWFLTDGSTRKLLRWHRATR